MTETKGTGIRNNSLQNICDENSLSSLNSLAMNLHQLYVVSEVPPDKKKKLSNDKMSKKQLSQVDNIKTVKII